MSEFEKYYDEELRFLNEGGQEFAEAFPERARHLNITTLEDRDPYVERLFEGFAFLTGRIREKLEDDFPEFAQNLMEMVDPAFLRQIPSLAMLQITFRSNMLPKPHLIPKGTLFLSNPVGADLTICRFQSTQDMVLYPLVLAGAEAVHHAVMGEGVQLTFHLDPGADLGQLAIPDLPIFLHGERPLSYLLHYFLTAKVSQVMLESEGYSHSLGGQEAIEAGGFGETENLLPHLDNSFEGSRLLQEFFCFEEKFRFVKLKGLERIAKMPAPGHFTVTAYFKESLPEGKRFSLANFKLHTTPVVNLFPSHSEPVNLNHRHFEYPLYADVSKRAEIYEVVSVTGVDKATGAMRPFHKFNEFRHQVLAKGDRAVDSWFQVRQEAKPKNRFQTYISVGTHKPVKTITEEYLSVTILATNGNLPREEVPENGIVNPHADFPTFFHFTNFTRPTVPVQPPKSEHYLWYVLAHMNMNYRSLCQKGNLKEILSLYDWTHSAVNRKMIDGVMGASAGKRNFLMAGQLLAGAEITVEIRDGAFSEAGELNIFARVLLEFFTQYASINHLMSLRILLSPSGKGFTLAPREGRCHLI
ncbi:MAG TPA: type VI secretion system baseplate subunit TssF [Fibrobacteria bacterium]|nr:type VI secretion system baseplate subunit TssF [Fibrobacteria bacterium]